MLLQLFLIKEFSGEIDESSSTPENLPRRKFNITISKEEWVLFKPRQVIYQKKEQYKSGTRTYNVLAPKEWGPVIADHFTLQTKLPCLLNFKRGKYVKTYNVIEIVGFCSECDSEFKGSIELERAPSQCER